MTQPTPTKPNCPTACGPSSHSPLPIEMPSAIRLGPTANLNSSRGPIRRTLKTSSGVGQIRQLQGRTTHTQRICPRRLHLGHLALPTLLPNVRAGWTACLDLATHVRSRTHHESALANADPGPAWAGRRTSVST